jgi:hypothetical protein
MNTAIGEICLEPEMKAIISKATCIVTFFNSSHYWGGQLKDEAAQRKISRGLQQNVNTQFYSLSLMAQSVISNRYALPLSTFLFLAKFNIRPALQAICICPDAQKKIGGLSPMASDIVSTVLWRKFLGPVGSAALHH